jgi:hypothetical protein
MINLRRSCRHFDRLVMESCLTRSAHYGNEAAQVRVQHADILFYLKCSFQCLRNEKKTSEDNLRWGFREG